MKKRFIIEYSYTKILGIDDGEVNKERRYGIAEIFADDQEDACSELSMGFSTSENLNILWIGEKNGA